MFGKEVLEAKQFISLLKNPKELANTSFDELNILSQQYPFVSLFHTLIAKKAYEEKPHEYDAYLTKAAMHALDRTKLYYIIHETKTEKKKFEEEVVDVISAITEEIVNADGEVSEISLETNNPEEFTDKPKISEEPIPFVAGSFTVSEKTEEKLPIKEIAVIKAVETVNEESTIKKEKKKKKKHKKKSKEEEIAPDTKLSFTDWLKLVNKKKLLQPETEESDEEEDEKDLEEQYHAGKFEAQLHKEADKESKTQATSVPKIPEKWKKASDAKAEVKISDLAQKSIQRDDNTITETLAKILELQKHYDKAIEAYEKLSLKYPEKSSYFATRILELKKKL